jgi:hypothetical protein
MINETVTLRLPAIWLLPLRDNDYSILTNAELSEFLLWLQNDFCGYLIDWSSLPTFYQSNDADALPCNCLDFTFDITP